MLEEHEESQGRAHQRVDQEPARLPARVGEQGRVLAEPLRGCLLQPLRVQQVLEKGEADSPGLQPVVHLPEDAPHLLEQGGERAHAAAGEAHDEQDDPGEGRRRQETEGGRGQDLGRAARQAPALDPPEGQGEERVGEEARDERDPEAELEDEEEARGDQGEGGRLGAGGPRLHGRALFWADSRHGRSQPSPTQKERFGPGKPMRVA